MKKLSLLLLVITFTLTACNKSDSSTPEKLDDQIYQKVVSTAKIPTAGETKISIFLDWIELQDGSFCDYLISQHVTVHSSSNDHLDISYTHTQSQQGIVSPNCPAQHPDYPSSDRFVTGTTTFVKNAQDRILANSSAVEYSKINQSVSAVKIINTEEIQFKNLRTQKVTMEMVSKTSGRRLLRTSFISLDSYFAGVFEIERKVAETGENLDGRQLMGLKLNNPPVSYGSL